LRQQQDALSRLVRKSAENDARRRDLDLDRQSKSESERQRVAAEVTLTASSSLYEGIQAFTNDGSSGRGSFSESWLSHF
jgi:hypothetical protein